MSEATLPSAAETSDERKRRLKRESGARYRSLHPETPAATRERYLRHKNAIADYAKKNTERIRKKSKAWYVRQAATPKGRARYYTKSAAKRGLAWELDDAQAEVLFRADCYYCDDPPAPLNGIDRYDNNTGYTPSNCVPCCTRCNYMKRSMSAAELLEQCRKIVDRMNKI